MWNGVFGAEEMRAGIDGKQRVPARSVEIGDKAGMLQAGVLRQNVKAAEPADASIEKLRTASSRVTSTARKCALAPSSDAVRRPPASSMSPITTRAPSRMN